MEIETTEKSGARQRAIPGKPDGRRERSAASRKRIMQAMLQLIEEGNPDPGAEAVAQRAGVGLRTVFRLFRDKESVAAEMLVPQRLQFVACFTAPFQEPYGAPRVREMFDRLILLYEQRMPIRRAATMRRYSSPSLAGAMRELDTTIDVFLRTQLPEGERFRLDMLGLLLSFDAWMRLRDEQRLSQEQAAATLRRAVEQVLEGI